MGSTVSNTVVRPVPGGSTSFPTGGLGGIFGNLGQLFSQVIGPVNQQPSPPVSLPVTPVNPSSSMSPIRRFNAVVDPKLSRTMSRPMFKPSRYDGQINQLLERLIPVIQDIIKWVAELIIKMVGQQKHHQNIYL
jgi:hypothetical protein